MYKRAQLIATLIALVLCNSSFASDGVLKGAAVVAGTSAAAYGMHSGIANSFQVKDLEDWENTSVGQAVDLDHSCKVSLETRLYNSNRKNFAVFLFKNDNAENIYIDYQGIRFIFDDHLERSSVAGAASNNYFKVDAYNYRTYTLTFPAKSDFKGKKELKIKIPFKINEKVCTLVSNFKNTINEDNPATYINSTSLEMSFDGGGLIGKTGENKHLFEGDESLFNLNFEIYKGPFHGYYFGISRMSLSGDLTTINSEFTDPTENNILRRGLEFGYVRRGIIKEKLSQKGYIGLAVVGLYDLSDTDGGSDSLDSSVALNIKYFLNYKVSTFSTVKSEGEWGVGLGLNAYKWVSGEIADQSLKGADISAQFRVYFGM